MLQNVCRATWQFHSTSSSTKTITTATKTTTPDRRLGTGLCEESKKPGERAIWDKKFKSGPFDCMLSCVKDIWCRFASFKWDPALIMYLAKKAAKLVNGAGLGKSAHAMIQLLELKKKRASLMEQYADVSTYVVDGANSLRQDSEEDGAGAVLPYDDAAYDSFLEDSGEVDEFYPPGIGEEEDVYPDDEDLQLPGRVERMRRRQRKKDLKRAVMHLKQGLNLGGKYAKELMGMLGPVASSSRVVQEGGHHDLPREAEMSFLEGSMRRTSVQKLQNVGITDTLK